MQDWVIRWGCFVCRLIKCPIICILLSCRGFFNNRDKHASNVRTLHQCINCGNATTDIISYTASSRKFHLQWPAPFFCHENHFWQRRRWRLCRDLLAMNSPWVRLTAWLIFVWGGRMGRRQLPEVFSPWPRPRPPADRPLIPNRVQHLIEYAWVCLSWSTL